MSVKFILGRGGSGKSTYMLEQIKERVQDNETSPSNSFSSRTIYL